MERLSVPKTPTNFLKIHYAHNICIPTILVYMQVRVLLKQNSVIRIQKSHGELIKKFEKVILRRNIIRESVLYYRLQVHAGLSSQY